MVNMDQVKSFREIIHKGSGFLWCLLSFAIPLDKRFIPLLILLLFLQSMLTMNFKVGYQSFRRHFLLKVMLLFFILHVTGLLYTHNITVGITDVTLKLSLIAFPLILAGNQNMTARFYNLIFLSFVLGCITASLICLGHAAYVYFTTKRITFFYSELSVFHHPSYFAMYLNFATVLIFSRIRHIISLRSTINLFYFILVLLLSFMIILLSSKAGILTNAFVLVYFFLLNIRNRNFRMINIVFAALAGFIYFVTFNFIISKDYERIQQSEQTIMTPSIIDSSAVESTAVRLLVWKAAKEVISESLPFGVGTGDEKDILLKKYAEKNYKKPLEGSLNAHNQFLQTTIGIGIPGLMVLLTLFFYSLVSGVRKRDFVLVMFVIITGFNFLTESMLETIAGVVFFSFFLTLLTTMPQKEKT